MTGTRFIHQLLAADPRVDKQALTLYHKAIRRAQRRLKAKGLADRSLWIGADEVAVELEWLLRGVCYFVNCLDSAAYQRLNQAVLNWMPAYQDPHQLLPCGLVQNGLLALLPQLQQKQRLEVLCERYQDHLTQAASVELKKQPYREERLPPSIDLPLSVQALISDSPTHSPPPAATQPTASANDPLSRIQEKKAAVSRMRQVWKTREDLSTQYRHFQSVFQQERRILEKDRDSVAMTFLKAVVTVLSFGLAAVCGIWSVKGQKTTQKIEQVFETPGPSTG